MQELSSGFIIVVHVREVLNHMWRRIKTGKLFRTSMEHAKMEIGMRGLLLMLYYDKYGFLCEDTWVKHLCKFAYNSGIEIEDDLEDFDYTREGDNTITSQTGRAFSAGVITKDG